VKHQGLTIFALFFGISLLDALAAGRTGAVLFWTAVLALFVALDHRARGRRVHL
jgi:hypothetical protein